MPCPYPTIISENVAPHTDVDHHADGEHHGGERRSPIAHHGQWNADHRHESGYHGDIDDHMPEENGDHAEYQQAAEAVLHALHQSQAVSDQDYVEQQQNQTTHEAPLLGKNRKDEVGMLSG